MINYRPYNTWAHAADWQHELPPGDSITAIGLGGVSAFDSDDLSPALGTGCIVAATSAGYLRFFGGSGLQRHISLIWAKMSLVLQWVRNGSLSCIVRLHQHQMVSLQQSILDLINHCRTGRQNLNYTIIDADTFEYVQQGHLPLMKKISLTWIGFTSDEVDDY